MKANIQVYQEMIELCQVINEAGKPVEGEPDLREITFGELFQIYVHINDKVVGLLLRARKHELLTFEVSFSKLLSKLKICWHFCVFPGWMLIPKVPRPCSNLPVKTLQKNQGDYDRETDRDSPFIKSQPKVSNPHCVQLKELLHTETCM